MFIGVATASGYQMGYQSCLFCNDAKVLPSSEPTRIAGQFLLVGLSSLQPKRGMLQKDHSLSAHQLEFDFTNPSSVQEVEIIYSGAVPQSPLKKIQSSEDAYRVLLPLFDPRKIALKEFFYVLLLNKANVCLGFSKVGVGALDGVVVGVKEIFQLAILSNAAGLILCHNHPSGNLKASQADIQLTQKIKSGCKYFDLTLLDHLIVTPTGYYSLNDEGLI